VRSSRLDRRQYVEDSDFTPHRLKECAHDCEHAQADASDPERKKAFGNRLAMLHEMLAAVPSAKLVGEATETRSRRGSSSIPK